MGFNFSILQRASLFWVRAIESNRVLTFFQYTQYVDPSLSIVIVIIIVASTIPLLKESSLVLMQTVPDNFQISDLRENLLRAVPEIIDIHEVTYSLTVELFGRQIRTCFIGPVCSKAARGSLLMGFCEEPMRTHLSRLTPV